MRQNGCSKSVPINLKFATLNEQVMQEGVLVGDSFELSVFI